MEIIIGVIVVVVLAGVAYQQYKKKAKTSSEQTPEGVMHDLRGFKTSMLFTDTNDWKYVGPNGGKCGTNVKPVRGRPMNFLSHMASRQWKDGIIENLKKCDANAIFVYGTCDADGHNDFSHDCRSISSSQKRKYGGYTTKNRFEVNPFSEEMWAPNWGNTINRKQVDMMKSELRNLRANKLEPIMWLFSDQTSLGSKKMGYKNGLTIERRKAIVKKLIDEFEEHVGMWCVALEANEHLHPSEHKIIVDFIHQNSKHPVACHLGAWRNVPHGTESAYISNCDVYFAQTDPNITEAELVKDWKDLKARYPKKNIAFAEMHRYGLHPTAFALRKKALELGAYGVG